MNHQPWSPKHQTSEKSLPHSGQIQSLFGRPVGGMELNVFNKHCQLGCLPGGTCTGLPGLSISFPPLHPPQGQWVMLGGIWKQVEKTPFWLPLLPAKIKSPLLDTRHILGSGLGHLLALFPLRKDGTGSVFISKCHEHLGQGWASIGTNNQPNLTMEGRV